MRPFVRSGRGFRPDPGASSRTARRPGPGRLRPRLAATGDAVTGALQGALLPGTNRSAGEGPLGMAVPEHDLSARLGGALRVLLPLSRCIILSTKKPQFVERYSSRTGSPCPRSACCTATGSRSSQPWRALRETTGSRRGDLRRRPDRCDPRQHEPTHQGVPGLLGLRAGELAPGRPRASPSSAPVISRTFAGLSETAPERVQGRSVVPFHSNGRRTRARTVMYE